MRAFVLSLVAAMVTVACEPLAPREHAPIVTSVGPISIDGDAVRISFSVADAEGDGVSLWLGYCPAEQRCSASACTAMRALDVDNPVSVRGQQGALHTLTWSPSCEPSPPPRDTRLVACVLPTHGAGLASAAFKLPAIAANAPCAPVQQTAIQDIAD